MPEKSLIDKALDILSKTNDGDSLDPQHLKLLEYAVNGVLNEKGVEVFNQLHEQVVAGQYQKPYLHGVEYMTRDHEGYIYYKGQHVEHYSSWWVYSLNAKQELEALQDQCIFLEKNGIAPRIFLPQELEEPYFEDVLKRLKALAGNDAITFTRLTCTADEAYKTNYLIPGEVSREHVWENPYQKDYISLREYDTKFETIAEKFRFGSGMERDATYEETKLINYIFDEMQEKKHITSLGSYADSHDFTPEYEEDCYDEDEL